VLVGHSLGSYVAVIEAARYSDVNSINVKSMQEIFIEYPRIEQTLYSHRAEITADLISFFRSGVEQGYLKRGLDPVFIVEMLQSFVLYFIRFDSSQTRPSLKIKTAIDCLLQGILLKQ